MNDLYRGIDTTYINIITTTICCLLAVAALMGEKKKINAAGAKYVQVSKYDKWMLIGAIGLLVITRLIYFGQIPAGYCSDTILSAVNAKSLAECGVDLQGMRYPVLFDAYGYSEQSVLMAYAMIPFIKLWGLNLVTITLPILLVSILGAMAVYGFAADVFDRKTAYIILLLVVINPWHFMQGRWALDCNMLPHIFVCGLFLLNRFCMSHQAKYLYCSMVGFALCMYAYALSFISVPVFLCIMCGIFLIRRIVNVKQALISAGIYFLISGPIYLCMIINVLKLDTIAAPFFTIPYLPGNTRAGDMAFWAEHPIHQLIENVKKLIYVVFYRHDNYLWNCIDGFGTIYVCTLPFVLLGICLLIRWIIAEKSINRKMGYLALLTFYFSSLCVGVICDVNINRINVIFYEHIIFAGIAVTYVMTHLKKSGFVIAGVYASMFVLFCYSYFTDWPQAFGRRFGKEMMDAIYYASEHDADEYHIDAEDMYIIFGFDMDLDYYYGETDAYRGIELAYQERFMHGEADKDLMGETKEDKSIIWVQRLTEKDKFEGFPYQIYEFGDWFVAVSDY